MLWRHVVVEHKYLQSHPNKVDEGQNNVSLNFCTE